MYEELQSRPSVPSMTLGEAVGMAAFSAVILVIYGVLQSCLTFLFGRANPPMKIMLEPPLLAMGFILHIHWVKVSNAYRDHGQPRPRFIAVADALSFIITFWALWNLVEAFLQKAKLI